MERLPNIRNAEVLRVAQAVIVAGRKISQVSMLPPQTMENIATSLALIAISGPIVDNVLMIANQLLTEYGEIRTSEPLKISEQQATSTSSSFDDSKTSYFMLPSQSADVENIHRQLQLMSIPVRRNKFSNSAWDFWDGSLNSHDHNRVKTTFTVRESFKMTFDLAYLDSSDSG